MKKFLKQASLVLAAVILIYACGKDDDPEPEPIATPTITSFSPSSGAVGTQVTITGTNFGATAASNVVKFGTVTATVSTASATSLVTSVPVGATTGKISVTANKKTATSATDFTVTKVDAFTIALNNTTLTLYPYPKYKETLKVITDIGNKSTTWTSSDETLAKVSQNGEVMPLAIGTVTITATVEGATANCVVTIKDGPVTKLTLEKTTLELYTNDEAVLAINKLELEAGITEPSATVWSSDNEAVATVDEQGKVTAISLGVAIITATVDNMTATCTVTVNPNVYVAGHEKNDQGFYVATLWKNGVPQALSDGTTNTQAYAVYVSGTDVYVVGYITNLGKKAAVLWKNGVVDTIGGEDSEAKSVFVKDTDVYVVGYQKINGVNKPILWKNGDPAINLSVSNTANYANSVYVSDTDDVYITGYVIFQNNTSAVLWKNGQLDSYLYDGGADYFAQSVYVSGNDVYVAGRSDSKPVLWKNDEQTQELSENGYAYSVVVSGNDVYVAGYGDSKAILWKNGVAQELNTNIGSARSVFVYGDDVYVAGFHNDDNAIAIPTLWKNGVAQELSENGEAYSVFVK